MKKLYTTILMLGLLIAAPGAMFAQSSTGSLYVGYAKYDDQLWEYDGVMLNKDSKVGCAILLTKDMIAPYAGGTIKGMRVGWGTTQMNGEYEGFVRNDFNGEDLSTGKAAVKYSYSDSNPGWNTMTMTDYVIPDDVEQLVVGFTTNVKSGVYAIPTIYPHYTKNSCYLWVDGDNDEEGNPRWVDHNEYGILPILLIVEDTQGTFSLLPVLTMLTPNGVVTAGEPSDCLMRLKNAGSQTINSIEVTSRQGEQTYSKKVTLSKAIKASSTSSSFQVSAGASFMPSPTIATRPCSCRRRTADSLPSGSTPATTSVTPASLPIARAVRSLSPVSITTLRPSFLSAATAEGELPFITSATAMRPRSLPPLTK